MHENTLHEAIELAKSGKKAEAQKLLEALLEAEPQNITAWLWYANTWPTAQSKVKALKLALRYNPNNEKLKQALMNQRTRLPQDPKPPLSQSKKLTAPPKTNLSNNVKRISMVVAVGAIATCLCLCATVAIAPSLGNSPTATTRPQSSPTHKQNITPNELQPTETQTVAPIESVTTPTQPILTATQPPTTTPAFTVLVLTSPIQVGGKAFVQIQTVMGANCFLSYTTPFGTESDANGLGETTADSNGICSWTWEIGGRTDPGTGRLKIIVNGMMQVFDIVIQ